MLGSRWILGSKTIPLFGRALSKRSIFTAARSNTFKRTLGVNSMYAKRNFSAMYYEEMYKKYIQDPNNVTEEWRAYFEGKDTDQNNNSRSSFANINADALAQAIAKKLGNVSKAGSTEDASEVTRILNLVRAYQWAGHLKAKTDPLKLRKTYGPLAQTGKKVKKDNNQLDWRFHGLTDEHLDKEYLIDASYQRGFLSLKQKWKLRELIDALEKVYCKNIGIEYMHIMDYDECNWIREKFEEGYMDELPKEKKIQAYDRLWWAVLFGDFLQSKYNTQKRFGLEGCDAFIPGLKTTIDRLVELGTESVTIGMPHRGRLNVLANVLRKPLDIIFQEFSGEAKLDVAAEWERSGDVKYHLGTSCKRTYEDTGKSVEIHLLPNPSHLELVDPVVWGYVRATQHYEDDQERSKNVGILVHGDAAFAGQGIVYETMQMTDLHNYGTGGTIHFIVNNQIGFTTTPLDAKSGHYCTELAKSVNAPILHVNGDDIDAVEKWCRFAAEYRHKFKKDIVIDIIGYRKYGHNELDQPSFTQPLMYEQIKNMKNVLDKYEDELVEDGVFTKEQAKTDFRDRIWNNMIEKYNIARQKEASKADWVTSEWDTIKVPKNYGEFRNTGLPIKKLKAIGEEISSIPEEFDAHRMVRKIYDARKQSIKDGVGIDWGTAEALAFATLIDDNLQVRISGQDVERGTFSHRHAVVHSQSRDEEYIPIAWFNQGRVRKFIPSNSHLSENAVLGFEYGYSIVNPNTLTIWEAQFGDFYNGAQAVVDQFICSGETKWNVSSGLVMLLPHGYDGAGPEHSSSRLERFLEMCDDDPDEIYDFAKDYFNENLKKHNWQIAFPSTSANYFHLLRRQMHRDYRKPLIVVAPKKLLKSKSACCPIEDFGPGLKFKRTIPERDLTLISDPNKVKKIIFWSGQVYYDLEKERANRKDKETAIITIEQLFPVPYDHLKDHFGTYPNATKVVWCQEEPKNFGAYAYMLPRFHSLFKKLGISDKMTIKYAGRNPNSSPATGFSKVHARQVHDLLKDAFE